MTLPYASRLILLALASFFLIHAVLAIVARCLLPSFLRMADQRHPDQAARFLLALRFFPFLAALLLVGTVCVPSFLLLEEPGTAEHAGFVGLALATLASLILTLSVLRATAAIVRTRSFVRRADALPPLLLTGIWTPRLHISRALAQVLPPQILAVALRHEEAHRDSRDNLKRLLLLLTPDIFPSLRLFEALDRHWATLAEWAADDRATAGDPQRAVQLAEALVQAARIGTTCPAALPVSLLLTADEDLQARVDRLLAPQRIEPAPRQRALWPASALCLLAAATTLATHPAALYPIHDLLERLMH